MLGLHVVEEGGGGASRALVGGLAHLAPAQLAVPLPHLGVVAPDRGSHLHR